MTKTQTRRKANLEILVTKEQVAQIQTLQAQINMVQNQQRLYIQAILDSQGIDGPVQVAGPTLRGDKWFLEYKHVSNPKKNGEA